MNRKDEIARGYHDIPSEKELKKMSFIEKCTLLSSCGKDSIKSLVIDREIKKQLAKDQAWINLKNIIIGTIIGGLFSLSGVILGYYLHK